MSVSINPPKTPVTEGSNGVATATVPNVCKMPGPPAPFVPTPLPNIGKSGMSPKDYSKDVTIEGKKVAIKGATFKSMGDVASKGTGGGLISANCEGPTSFVGPGSMDVKIEGKNVQLLADPMLNNCGAGGSPANAATLVGLIQETGLAAIVGDEKCPLCHKEHGPDSKLEETPASKGAADQLKAFADAAVQDAQRRRREAVQAMKRSMQTAADGEYESKRSLLTERMNAARSEKGVAHNRDELAKLTRRVVSDEEAESAVPSAELTTMLGVVVCKTNEVYAGNSKSQVKELYEQVKGMHALPPTEAIFGASPGAPKLGLTVGEASRKVKNKAAFADAWSDMKDANERYNDVPKDTPVEEKGEPFYPPGQCAAQQMVVLALDHDARPVALTERWYKSKDPDAKVYVYARTTLEDKAGKGAWFGGLNKDRQGAPQAVPPCGTCQVILTMLLCPDEHSKECAHSGKKPLSECKCP